MRKDNGRKDTQVKLVGYHDFGGSITVMLEDLSHNSFLSLREVLFKNKHQTIVAFHPLPDDILSSPSAHVSIPGSPLRSIIINKYCAELVDIWEKSKGFGESYYFFFDRQEDQVSSFRPILGEFVKGAPQAMIDFERYGSFVDSFASGRSTIFKGFLRNLTAHRQRREFIIICLCGDGFYIAISFTPDQQETVNEWLRDACVDCGILLSKQ